MYLCGLILIMGRILAVDYGAKRSGLAVTDSLQMIANGLAAVSTTDLFNFIAEYCKKEEVECIVVGYPKTLQNQPAEVTKLINPFVEKLRKVLQINVELVDERFTSKIALQTMVTGGMKKKDRQNKGMLDQISATIILQSYLESKRFPLL